MLGDGRLDFDVCRNCIRSWLKPFRQPTPCRFVCDGCDSSPPPGSQMWGSTISDYDLCKTCALPFVC